MNKKEVTEIKRRIKAESWTCSVMTGCYVDAQKEKVLTFRESPASMEDEELHKYTDIANKALSGKIGNNLMELQFPQEAEEDGGIQKSLLALRDNGLKSDEMLESFYDTVIKNYDFTGNYLILLYHDVYDVPLKTSDNMKLDDSEEVYDYIICVLVPVALSKPGLGYNKDENRITALTRNWVVGVPDTAFTFPCFTDRSQDIHSILLYTKNTKEPHKEFWQNALMCEPKYTASEKKEVFTNIISESTDTSIKKPEDLVLDIQESINDFIEERAPEHTDDDPLMLESRDIKPILKDNGFSEEDAENVSKKFNEVFSNEPPKAEDLIDNKAIKQIEERADKKALQNRVVDLTNKLEEAGALDENDNEIDVILRISPEKADQVTRAYVNGRSCVVIPVDDNEEININGEIIDI